MESEVSSPVLDIKCIFSHILPAASYFFRLFRNSALGSQTHALLLNPASSVLTSFPQFPAISPFQFTLLYRLLIYTFHS